MAAVAARVCSSASAATLPARQVAVVAPRARCPGRGAWAPGPCFSTGREGSRASLACQASKGGVMDSPTITTQPGLEKGTENVQKRPPIYKVMLHNDNYNRREYVVKILLKVVQAITMDDAVVVMQEAHETGVALVIACPQEDAEQYCEGLRLNGLTCTLEPGC